MKKDNLEKCVCDRLKEKVMAEILQVTQKGRDVLQTLQNLSEMDIRLIGFIANKKSSFEHSVEGAEYIGFKMVEIQRLQMLGYIK